MRGLLLLFLATMGLASLQTPMDGQTGTISLLDIIKSPELAATCGIMMDNSPGYSYIDVDLRDINLLKVSIRHGDDDSVISQMEMATNSKAATWLEAEEAWQEEMARQRQSESSDLESIN
ncbi:unnamed protein product [Aureobasidium mustum]|uniref:Uncharacterized protein n=1 Tax=Aureobasidium mustum TaxID=2773714 RepID=A0A9N8PLN8_9PEZI|nr:unnamed protein product [Aureobasidium mustum]